MRTTIKWMTIGGIKWMMFGGSAMLVTGVLQCAVAQTAPPAAQAGASSSTPGRIADTPRPDELEPGVKTSDVGGPAAPQGNTPGNAQRNRQRPATPDANSNSASRSKAAAPGPSGPAAARSGTGAQATKAAGAASGKAQDHLELDETQITGNRELPKVLYIVPWKRSDLGDLVGKPVNSLIDEVLSPVDRDVFKRENRYYDALKPDESKQGAAGAPAGAGPAAGAAPATGAAPAGSTGAASGSKP